jgi:voltage-gated potassium channel
MSPRQRLIGGICAFIAIVAIGVVGYEAIEGWSLIDSLYMTITTITTVGYMEVHPLSQAGRIFSIFLIVGGVGGALYLLVSQWGGDG